MDYYIAEIRFNKKKSENSEKKVNKRKLLIASLITLTLISLLVSAPVMLFSVTDCIPPEIVSVTRSPETPNYDQSVTVTAQVTRGSADIDSVILSYQIESASWINVTMSLDDGFYVAGIPAQPYNTAVNYKVYASDIIGTSVVSGLFSYTVGDFVPPVISNVL